MSREWTIRILCTRIRVRMYTHSRDTRFPLLYPVSWLNTLTKQHTYVRRRERESNTYVRGPRSLRIIIIHSSMKKYLFIYGLIFINNNIVCPLAASQAILIIYYLLYVLYTVGRSCNCERIRNHILCSVKVPCIVCYIASVPVCTSARTHAQSYSVRY